MTVKKNNKLVELLNGDFTTTAQCDGCGQEVLITLPNDPQKEEPVVLCEGCRGGE